MRGDAGGTEFFPGVASYIVHHGDPALHGDTLKDGDHGKGNVIERGDPKIRPYPLI